MKENKERNESVYCNYNEAFENYDQVRQPNGLIDLLKIFKQNQTPLEEQVVLEGGFGTGEYINHIRHHVKEIYGVEGSDVGYRQARQKMGDAKNVRLQTGNILGLPLSDDYFHVYMVNQVIHHLDTQEDFPNLDIFFFYCRRVLKPGGVLTINTSSPDQLTPGSGVYWNYKYIEKAAYALRRRYIPIEDIISRLEELQFTDIKTTIPSEKIFQKRYYTDPYIALEPDFRKGDSVYILLSQKEIEDSNGHIRKAIEDDSIFLEMKRAEKRSAQIGEAVIVSARKANET